MRVKRGTVANEEKSKQQLFGKVIAHIARISLQLCLHDTRSELAGAKCWNSISIYERGSLESIRAMFAELHMTCVVVSTAQKWKKQQQWLALTNQPKIIVSVCNLCRIQHFIFAVFFRRRIHRFIILLRFIERGHSGMNDQLIDFFRKNHKTFTSALSFPYSEFTKINCEKKTSTVTAIFFIISRMANGQLNSYIPVSGRCRCQFLFDDIQNKIHADVRSVLFIWFLIDVHPSLGKSRTVWFPCWNVYIYRYWRKRR